MSLEPAIKTYCIAALHIAFDSLCNKFAYKYTLIIIQSCTSTQKNK